MKNLSISEMKKIDGGGWIADAVAWLKCGCQEPRTGGSVRWQVRKRELESRN